MPAQAVEKPTLVGLSAEYKALTAEIIALGGELTPENEAMLQGVVDSLCEKTDGYGIVLEQLENQAAFWKMQEKKCAESRRAIENAIESLKSRMKFVLGQTEGEALQGELYRFFLAKAAPRMEIDDSLLPVTFKKSELVVTPDRDKIKAYIAEKTECPPGVTLVETKALRTGRPK